MIDRIGVGDALVTDHDTLEPWEEDKHIFCRPNMDVLFRLSICSNGFKKH